MCKYIYTIYAYTQNDVYRKQKVEAYGKVKLTLNIYQNYNMREGGFTLKKGRSFG